MINLQYFIHQLLNSKYILLINLFLIFCFYLIFYGAKFIYCMNENTDITSVPIKAEAKETIKPSHQIQAIIREIDKFSGQYEQIQQQSATIDNLSTENLKYKEENIKLKKKMYEYIQQKESVRESFANQRKFLNDQRMEIALEKSRVEKATRYIQYLEDRVRNLSIENVLLNKQLNIQGLRGTAMEELEQTRLRQERILSEPFGFSISSEDIEQQVAEEKTRTSIGNQISKELSEKKSKSILDGGHVRGRRIYYNTK